MPLGKFRYRIPIRFTQFPDNLFFAVPALLHADSACEDQLSLHRFSPKTPISSVSPQIFLYLIETNIIEKVTLDQLVANAVLNEEYQLTCNLLILL